jgi:predicted GNAT family N-acyltransferase
MKQDFSIREIQDFELEELYHLRQEVLRTPLGLNIMDHDLASEETQIKIGAFLNEQLIGCVLLKILDLETIKIRQMAVANDYQGYGFGNTLMQFVEEFCTDNSFKKMELNARENVKDFYLKLGYRIEGDSFLEVNIPHLLMTKEINLD